MTHPADEARRGASASRGDGAASSDRRSAEAPQSAIPTITLPTGGGAIRGIDEKLTVALATGAATLIVPIATTPGRSALDPQLTLSYDSGAGNGPFGLGWRLAPPSIIRKTARGLPRYTDDDVMLLSDTEDLVPALAQDGTNWAEDAYRADGFAVQRSRPRVDHTYARIERWTADTTGETHWRTTTRDNVTNVFGTSATSRIAAPGDPSKVFAWLLEATYDAFGNAVVYDYKAEDTTNVPPSPPENHRGAAVNTYLKRIRYVPAEPYDPTRPPADWRVTVVLDYGEHDLDAPTPDETASWSYRTDAFSSYRSGFEIRTRRLCRRILTFHSFPELGADPLLVASTDLGYAAATDPTLPAYSTLTSMTRTGYLRRDGAATRRSLPPLEFSYTPVTVDPTVNFADRDTLANLPAGVSEPRWQWADLDGEGLPGVLTDDDRAWYYRRNVSASQRDAGAPTARFEPIEVVAAKPSGTAASSRLALMDLNGAGTVAAVDFTAPVQGFHQRTAEGGWAPFTTFTTTAAVDLADPNVRRVDLDGDGLADLLLTGDDAFTWFAWRGVDGYAPGGRVVATEDEEAGPTLVFADAAGSVFLADMTGDGLSDLVRVRNSEICYWPNLGYGRFGTKVVMAGAPVLDSADAFTARRVRLADIDGTGAADLIYLGRDGVRVWFNCSGNEFTAPTLLDGLPGFDDTTSVATVDLLGAGTTCLVWSSAGPCESGRALRYVDLMSTGKPHLLAGIANNLGANTTLEYATSTRYYLQDRRGPHPWVTKLAFPVHVVARKIVADEISGSRLVSTYTYHHGYFDAVEREFRGFAMVEQSDAEFVAASPSDTYTAVPPERDGEFVLPPARTCTWIHTGAFVGGRDLSAALAEQYWAGDPQALQLGSAVLPDPATADEQRQAARALRGAVLRSELYADDGTAASSVPYTVSGARHAVRMLQPAQGARDGCFAVDELEALTASYERNADDPRVQHVLNLEIDQVGTIRKSATIGYPRRAAAYDEQRAVLATYREHDVVHVTDQRDWYRLAVPIETREYELGIATPATLIAASTLLAPFANVDYAAPAALGQRRLFARSRVIYRSDDLASVLPLNGVERLALVDRTYTLGLTATTAASWFADRIADPSAPATADGGWVDLDGDGSWWAPSGRLAYSADPAHPDAAYAAAHFYRPRGEQDPYGGFTALDWDPHDLAPVHRTDPVGNTLQALVNYRVLRPWLLTDTNTNRTGVRFDELGLVIATAVLGKAAGGTDAADHFDLAADEAAGGDDPTQIFSYDLDAFRVWAHDPSRDPAHPAPASAQRRSRLRHGDPDTPWIETYLYSDGFGRIVLTKAQAEPGPAPQRDADGNLVRDTHGALVLADTVDRWVGTGRVVHDNKGNPVKAYEPFFDSVPGYESDADLVEWGVTAITRYDPVNRPIRVDKPDGTYLRTDFDAWQQSDYDENDTVTSSAWFAARSAGALGADQQDAASKAAAHADTPHVTDLDALGRVFRIVEDGPTGQLVTRHGLDIQGRVRTVTDALDRVALSTDHDMTGTIVRTTSIDAGPRCVLSDATSKPLLQWDGRDQELRHVYDAARRPVATYLSVSGGPATMCAHISYGETAVDAARDNLRGAVSEHRDQAGVETITRRDLHGNVLSVTRNLPADPGSDLDWAHPPALPGDLLTTGSEYDALSRVVSVTTPDGATLRPTYGARSLLAALSVQLPGGDEPAGVRSVAYDTKGQRQSIGYDNGAVTAYTYDPQTFRLIRLLTTRPAAGSVQVLSYSYDPVGNVTRVADAAQSTIFFANQLVAPVADYTYDATYRLVRATGREHIGQVTDWDDSSRQAVLPTDPAAMRNYVEAYSYDLIGNLVSLVHTASGGSWTRSYRYDEPRPAPTTNRLTSTQIGATVEPYSYDGNGNMASLPHLSAITWDYCDQLRSTATQDAAQPVPTTWYRYDNKQARVRKALVRADGTLASERVYLGVYERYREFAGNGAITLERRTVVISDGARHLALVDTTTDAAHPAAAPVTTTRYQLAERLESSCVEIDENAAVISYEEYYPYGSTSFQAGRSQAEVGLKRYRFTGRERDIETGFGYHGLRYYASWLGRWTSPDPAGVVDGLGLYSYARDNPVRLADPQGTNGTDPLPEFVAPSPAVVAGASVTNADSAGVGGIGSGVVGTGTSPFATGSIALAYVFGMGGIAQGMFAVGPSGSAQAGSASNGGVTSTGQVQVNLFHDPDAANRFLIFAGTVTAFVNNSPAAWAATLTLGQENVTPLQLTHPDFGHPASVTDFNVVFGAGQNQGGVAANSNYTWFGSVMLGVGRTITRQPYFHDALTRSGHATTSSVSPVAWGYEAWLMETVGGLALPGARTATPGFGIQGGVDLFLLRSFARRNAGSRVDNVRDTVSYLFGVWGGVDNSGPGATPAGVFGIRLTVTGFTGGGPAPVPPLPPVTP